MREEYCRRTVAASLCGTAFCLSGCLTSTTSDSETTIESAGTSEVPETSSAETTRPTSTSTNQNPSTTGKSTRNCAEDESSSEPAHATSSKEFPSITLKFDEFDGGRDLKMSLAIVEAFSPTSPAVIEMTLKNTSSEHKELEVGPTPPFSWFWGSEVDGSSTLVLVPDDRTYVGIEDANDDGQFTLVPDSPTDGCWRSPDRPVAKSIGRVVRLEPCGELSQTYSLLAAPDSDSCLQPGEFRFVDETYFGNDQPWGFTVVLENDGN